MRGQRHVPAALYPRERSGTHCTGGWVGPRAGLDMCGKSRPTGFRSSDRPARSQSLYRIRSRSTVTYEQLWISLCLRKESRNWYNGLPTESALDSYHTLGQDTACLCPIDGHRAHKSQTLDSALGYFRSVPFKYWQPVALRYIWTARSHYVQCPKVTSSRTVMHPKRHT